MFKTALLTLMSITGLFAQPVPEQKEDTEIVSYQYIRVGSGTFVQKNYRYLGAAQIGIGSKFLIDDHLVDISTDIMIHPSYQGVSTAFGYAYAPKMLKGVYFGPCLKLGTFIYDYDSAFAKRLVVQFPLVIGHKTITDRGFLTFVEAQIGLDGYVAISTGIGF